MPNNQETITHFLIEEQRRVHGSGQFTSLLSDLVSACKMISSQVKRGALVGIMGQAGSENVQGEDQIKLDVIANDIMLRLNEVGGHYAAMASEEMEDIYAIPNCYPRGKYLLLFDPLDGSSNTDVNISVGTIFSILKCPDGVTEPTIDDFLQPGAKQLCAGYALYGSSTMMVLTTGQGVNGFTFDQAIGEFILTHPNMTIPEETSEFAINASRERHWHAPVAKYIADCKKGKEGPRGRDFNMRWVASMVAEVHRVICRGGIFLYPSDKKLDEKGGKLRLMYEANPMAMIVEQAGGMATTGKERLLDVKPEGLHQRVSVVMGSKKEVETVVGYFTDHAEGQAA